MKFFLESYINQINDFLINEDASVNVSVSKDAMQAGMREYANTNDNISKDKQRKNLKAKLAFIEKEFHDIGLSTNDKNKTA